MNSPILLRKIIRNAEDYGVLIALKKVGAYFLKPIYEKQVYRIYGIDLENFTPKPFNGNGFAFRLLDKNDSDLIKQIEKMEEWLQSDIVSKLAKQGLCIVALAKNRVVGFNLIAFNNIFIPLLSLKRALKRGEAWSEQITVHKDFRKHGLAAELRYRIFAELKSRGIKKLYGGALTSNLPSLKLAQKVGFEFLMDVHFRKILHFKSWRYEEVKSESLS